MGHILANAPSSRLVELAASLSPALRIEAERISLNELAELILNVRNEILGPDASDVIITRTESAELERQAKANPDDFELNVKWVYDQGLGVVGNETGGNWREWWPEWNAESLEDVVRAKFLAL